MPLGASFTAVASTVSPVHVCPEAQSGPRVPTGPIRLSEYQHHPMLGRQSLLCLHTSLLKNTEHSFPRDPSCVADVVPSQMQALQAKLLEPNPVCRNGHCGVVAEPCTTQVEHMIARPEDLCALTSESPTTRLSAANPIQSKTTHP